MPLPASTSLALTTRSSNRSVTKASPNPMPSPSSSAVNRIRNGRGCTWTGGEARSTNLTVAVFSSADNRASWMRNKTPK